jgi:hypothetical protein
MLRLKLSFSADDKDKDFEIRDGELLNEAVSKSLVDVPLGKFTQEDTFNVTVNGLLIEKDFWGTTSLRSSDIVVVSPKIHSGDSGQIFKTIAIIAITVYTGGAAAAYFGSAGVAAALATAAVTVIATSLLNSLIPPPVPRMGSTSGTESIEDSQMYAISGQSNRMLRLGIVPKVYGSHRMYPNLAANPYTELVVDAKSGEIIQYLYGIYDFGLGTMNISELKIGDTPLTTDSFEDFDIRLVDPMKPEIDEDAFDEALESEFNYYRNRRVFSPLSVTLADGEETIQNADSNTLLVDQELIVDFLCPRGLYGYSSNGTKGDRSIRTEIHFALVGTTDWRSYNDMAYVSSHSAVGGQDATNFDISLSPDGTTINYYDSDNYSNRGGYYEGEPNYIYNMTLRQGVSKLLVADDTRLSPGAKIFHGTHFLGNIVSLNNLGGPKTEILLDRAVNSRRALKAYTIDATQAYEGVPAGLSAPFDIKKIRHNGYESAILIVSSNKTSPVYGQVRFAPKIAGAYKVRVRRVSTFGIYSTQTSHEFILTGITTAFQELPIVTNKRHCFLELRIRATDQLNGNIQNLSGVVSAAVPIYDSGTLTWARGITSNPAWIFTDLLTGEVNKKAVALDRIDLDSIVAWAEYCAEVPTPPPTFTYRNPRFLCNFILDYEATLQSVLAQVGGAAQASLNIIDGKYGVLIDRTRTTPIQIFTPRNSSGFSSTRLYGPRPHALKVKFIDPQLDWEISEAIAYDSGYDESTATEFEEVTSFACTNFEQAWRFGRYLIAQNKLRQETISLSVDFENIVCTRGDYVQITQDVMRVGGRPARVKAVSGITVTIDDSLDIDPNISYGYVSRSATGAIVTSTLTPLTPTTYDLDGTLPTVGDLIVIGEVGSTVYDCIVKSISPNDDLSAELVLVERANEIFDYESTDVLPTYNPQISTTSDPDFKPPKAVTNLLVADNVWECSELKSGYNYFIYLTWDIPQGTVYEFFEVWVNDDRGYVNYANVSSGYYKYQVAQDRLDIEHRFKVLAVSASGKKLQLIAVPEVAATPASKATAPSDVTALGMSITNQVIQLSWDKITDCDCLFYSVRYSPQVNDLWESSSPLVDVPSNLNSLSIQGRTGVYMIKAFDFNGNQSAAAARAITTIPSLFDLNVIDTMNEAPTFTGVLSNTELLGEAVILQEEVPGNVDSVQYFTEGFYEYANVLDLGDVFSVRLQSLIRADGLKKGELMSEWVTLTSLDHLNTAQSSDWGASLQYRATDVFAAMSDWVSLSVIDHINYGAGIGFTGWRDIPTVGDATGRIFQFRVKLSSYSFNITPRLFDATVNSDMPDRVDSFENLVSHATLAYAVTYDPVFNGPGTSPNIQISIDGASTGDYWTITDKTLAGFSIRFYNSSNVQVSRQFDVSVKGYGRMSTVTI